MTDFIAPGSSEWLKLITPSKVPSILGVSRFKSQYTLWHEMAGLVDPAPISEGQQDDFDYGHAAEMAAAEYWKYKNPGWLISRGEVQLTDESLPFPNLVTVDRRAVRGAHRRVVEVKTARDLEEWGDDGTGDTPSDYAAQVLAQMVFTGWTKHPGNIVLWPQYGKPKIYTVEFKPAVAEWIIAQCIDWMESLRTLTPPPLDDSVTCYETVRALHPDIDGTDAEVDPVLAVDYLQADRDAKAADKYARGLKTKLLDAMGSARYAKVGDVKIADRRANSHKGVSLYAATKTDPATLRKGSTAA